MKTIKIRFISRIYGFEVYENRHIVGKNLQGGNYCTCLELNKKK